MMSILFGSCTEEVDIRAQHRLNGLLRAFTSPDEGTGGSLGPPVTASESIS